MMKNRMTWLGAVTALAVVLLACATQQASPEERGSRSATAPAEQIATPPRLNIELGADASFAATTLGPA